MKVVKLMLIIAIVFLVFYTFEHVIFSQATTLLKTSMQAIVVGTVFFFLMPDYFPGKRKKT